MQGRRQEQKTGFNTGTRKNLDKTGLMTEGDKSRPARMKCEEEILFLCTSDLFCSSWLYFYFDSLFLHLILLPFHHTNCIASFALWLIGVLSVLLSLAGSCFLLILPGSCSVLDVSGLAFSPACLCHVVSSRKTICL